MALACLGGSGAVLAAPAEPLLSAASVPAQQALSPALRQWLDAQPPWRLAPERDYGPFIYLDDSGPDAPALRGLSVDALQLVAKHIGLRYQPGPAAPLQALLEAAQRGEVDFLTSLRPTPERSAYLLFTDPYVSVPAVVVSRARSPEGLSLLQGRQVAVGQGYAVEAFVRQRYPQVAWVSVPDDVAALKEVSAGHVEAAVVDQASFAFVQQRYQLANLHVGEAVGFDYALSFAVRKDLPQLRDALELGVKALTPAERQTLRERWLMADALPLPQPWLVPAAFGLLLLGLGLLAWRWYRRRKPPAPAMP